MLENAKPTATALLPDAVIQLPASQSKMLLTAREFTARWNAFQIPSIAARELANAQVKINAQQ